VSDSAGVAPAADDPHAATRRLLVAELDGPRFSHPGYLRWFYDDNPRGAALQEHDDDPDTGRRVGHYAVVPTRFRRAGGAGPEPFIFSTNVATDSTIRRSGSFRRMAERMYAEAAATGAPAMVGVGNDQSTVVVVDRFGWARLGPMRARMLTPLPGRNRVESHVVDTAFLASDRFAAVTQDLDWVPVRGWTQSWDTDFLRWRLSRPDGEYILHVADDAIAVTHRAPGPLNLPVAVLLKVLPRRGASLPLRVPHVVRAAAIAHHTPFVLYVGWNAHVHVTGVLIPRRFQPSPLNVVLKVLDPARVDASAFTLDTWELLDMDAY
jgi:hypothetical protein